MPNNEVMMWTSGVNKWLEWYDNVEKCCAEFDSICPDHVKDNPENFNTWYRTQVEKEKNKMKSHYKK